jgi:hypothetical protein
MYMKKQLIKRLTLNKETLRQLTGREAAGVAGGLTLDADCTGTDPSLDQGGTCVGCQHTRAPLCN